MRLRSGKEVCQQQLAPPPQQRRSAASQQSSAQPQQPATASNQPSSPLLALPDELIGKVFEHLDAASRKAMFQSSWAVARSACLQLAPRLLINFSDTPLPTLRTLRLLDRHTRIRCLTLAGTYNTDTAYMLDFLRKSLDGSKECLLLQGIVELRLKGWSIGKKASAKLGALIRKQCPNVRTMWLGSTSFCTTLFDSLAQVQELHMKLSFCSDFKERSWFDQSIVKAVLPLRSLRSLSLEMKVTNLTGVEQLPGLRHLQLGKMYGYDCDVDVLEQCQRLESVTFLWGAVSYFSSPTLKRLVCLLTDSSPCFGAGPNLGEQKGIGEASLPMLEAFVLDRACTGDAYGSVDRIEDARAGLAHFLHASPRAVFQIKDFLIRGCSLSSVARLLEPLAGRLRVQHLDCTISQLSDSDLEFLVSVLPADMLRVRLRPCSLSAAGLASAVLAWHKLEVLEVVGFYEHAELLIAMCEAVQCSERREKPLQVRPIPSFVNRIGDGSTDAQHRQWWMSQWQQRAAHLCGAQVKVQLHIK